MSKREYHVVPDGRDWVVRRDGSDGPISVHSCKREAVRAASTLAQRDRAGLIVHGRGAPPRPVGASVEHASH